MKIFSTIFSLGKTALGFLSPAGTAFKIAPWALAGLLAVALYVEHERLVAADDGIKTAQAKTSEAVQECNAQTASTNAAANAGVVAIQSAGQAVDQTRVTLAVTQAQQAQQEAAQKLGSTLSTITVQSTQAGQDGPISPPVLAEAFQ